MLIGTRIRRALYFIARYGIWLGRHRPRRMFRRNRPIDSLFAVSEKLYLRCKRDWLADDGTIETAKIRFPTQSVNRGKHSKVYDVLLPEADATSLDLLDWGVFSISVGNIPTGETTTAGKVTSNYTFAVQHDPLHDNYGHSEIRVFKDGQQFLKSNVSEIVKKKYRLLAARNTQVKILPVV